MSLLVLSKDILIRKSRSVPCILNIVPKYNLDHFSVVENGWQTNTGFLNDEIQRVHDNDYYHAFSYSVKSKVQYDEWKDIVGTLNHTAGFKKFADYQLETPSEYIEIETNSVVPGFANLLQAANVIRAITATGPTASVFEVPKIE